jgi:SAM-dependent methyltransferase
VTINGLDSAIDEGLRETGLEAIRMENNSRVLDAVGAVRTLSGSKLLDVGSAHGWFLDAAASRGATVEGIEPDEVIAANSLHQKIIRVGFFTDVLKAPDLYDVISCNDVLEHLPDPAAAMRASFDHLVPGGVLSINIPTSDGLAFAVARVCARLGARGPYERLWQKGLPSPHLWYFGIGALERLGINAGFEVAHSARLPALSRTGLWERVHMDRRPSLATRIQFFGISVLRPLLNSRRFSDIAHLVLRKPSHIPSH